jgi:hypothetical protein
MGGGPCENTVPGYGAFSYDETLDSAGRTCGAAVKQVRRSLGRRTAAPLRSFEPPKNIYASGCLQAASVL